MGSLGKLHLLGSAVLVMLAAGTTGCARHEEQLGENLVKASPSGAVDKLIGDPAAEGAEQYRVLNGDGLTAALASGAILSPQAERAGKILAATPAANTLTPQAARKVLARGASNSTSPRTAPAVTTPAAKPDSLLVGFPVGLVGERQMFGGVVTKVSDRSNEDLGMLKLSDLPPLHVRTVIANSADAGQPANYSLFLVGCVSKCEEGSDESPLLGFPIVGVDEKNGLAILDVAPAGKELNIMDAIDPVGLQTGYKTDSVKATAVDYSTSTLVFDVQSTMKKLITMPGAPQEVSPLVITARWYLRLQSAFASDFDTRLPTPGVGFFLTDRAKQPRITRFRKPSALKGSTAPVGVKYYVKNVPLEYRKAFGGAFEQWNVHFKALTGKPIFTYEFVDANTPQADALVAGDIRYNILEWDLDNLAPYGGLGPSVANQFTGENLSANVLIQGPTVVELYSKWFKVGQDVTRLADVGAVAEANEKHQALMQELQEDTAYPTSHFVVRMAEGLDMRVPAQEAALEDPLAARDDFDLPPQGMTYSEYMDGYFLDMVTHELGHNLGLRHNFYGNLGATDEGTVGSVSRSVMEYLGRAFRHLDRVGDYDKMAIAYGYAGKAPESTTQFCTDEDVAAPGRPNNSAECSRDDATKDPYGYLSARLARAVDLLTNAGSKEKPTWALKDLNGVLNTTALNLGMYALSAERTGAKWMNFYGKAGRPDKADAVKEFVLNQVKTQLCGKRIDDALAGKTGEALETAKKNVEDAHKAVQDLFDQIGLGPSEDSGVDPLMCEVLVAGS